MSYLFCQGSPIQADLSRLNCGPCCPVQVALSQISYANCPATVVPCPCPIQAVPSLLSCSRSLSSVFFPVRNYPYCLLWLSCNSCPVLAVLSWLSCPGYCVLAVLSQLSCANCPAPAILFTALLILLSNFCCPVLACPLCSPQAHFSRLKAQLSG